MSTEVLTVYHGTTSLIDVIDVSKGKPYKDFGRGFYVTQDLNHAIYEMFLEEMGINEL